MLRNTYFSSDDSSDGTVTHQVAPTSSSSSQLLCYLSAPCPLMSSVEIYQLTPMHRLTLGQVRPTSDSTDRTDGRPRRSTPTMTADNGCRQYPTKSMSAKQTHTVPDRPSGRTQITDSLSEWQPTSDLHKAPDQPTVFSSHHPASRQPNTVV